MKGFDADENSRILGQVMTRLLLSNEFHELKKKIADEVMNAVSDEVRRVVCK